jgi:hypoxanthine phosphoribosyltransferase
VDQLTLLISREQIAAKIAEMGARISADFAGQPIVLIGVLRGSAIFLADLARRVSLDVSFDFIAVSSYRDTRQSGEIKLIKDVDESLEGRNVILVEDILDTGVTLTYITKLLSARQPKTLRIAALLDKPGCRVIACQADYVGFQIPPQFVVGYGLDFAQRYRNLPDIHTLEPDPAATEI